MRKILISSIILMIVNVFLVYSYAANQVYLYNGFTLDKSYDDEINEKYCLFNINESMYLYSADTGKIATLGPIKNYRYPNLSPDGSKVVYTCSRDNANEYKLKVGIYDVISNTSKEVILDSDNMYRINSMYWLNNDTLGAEGYINSDTSRFVVYDATTYKLIKSYIGLFFSPSFDGKYILYKKNTPHLTKKTEPDTLCIDDQAVYKSDDLNYEISAPKISKTSKKVSFIERKGDVYNLVTADMDFPSKKIMNIAKAELSNVISSNIDIYFDDDDNVCVVDSNYKYQYDKQNQKWIQTKNIIDKLLKETVDAKMSRLRSAVINKFKNDISGNQNQIDAIVSSTINNAHWLDSNTIARLYPVLNNGIKVMYNNNPVIFDDVEPINKSGHILIPLRAVMENMGAEVHWDSESRVITIQKNNNLIKLSVDNNKAYINGIAKDIDFPAKILDGRTVIPIRFVSESFGMKVKWVPETSSVLISE